MKTIMKRAQECNPGQRRLVVFVVVLTCIGFVIQVQWTLYTHSVKIEGLMKQIVKEQKHKRDENEEGKLL